MTSPPLRSPPAVRPDVGGNEVLQIVCEYLGGLVEESPLKDVFAAWTGRLAGHAARRTRRR